MTQWIAGPSSTTESAPSAARRSPCPTCRFPTMSATTSSSSTEPSGGARARSRAKAGTSFTVSGGLAGVAPGDHVIIGACFKDNYIAGNAGTSCRLPGRPALRSVLRESHRARHRRLRLDPGGVARLHRAGEGEPDARRIGLREHPLCGYNTLADNKVYAGRATTSTCSTGPSTAPARRSRLKATTSSATPRRCSVRITTASSAPSNTGTYKDSGGNTEAVSPFTYDDGG